jgi:hypothetical protein
MKNWVLLIITLLLRFIKGVDVYLDIFYSGTLSDGSQSAPFKTLSECFTALSSTDGSIIILKKSSLTLLDRITISKALKIVAEVAGCSLNFDGPNAGFDITTASAELRLSKLDLTFANVGNPKTNTFLVTDNGRLILEVSSY